MSCPWLVASPKGASPVATMSIHSRAIHSSISESERIRVAGMLLVLAATFCLALLRRLLATESSEAMLLERTMWLLASLAAYESGLLFLARRARSVGNDLQAILWRTNTFVEIGILSAGLAAIGSAPGAQERVVLAPTAAMFFLFIILSSLRLEPLLCAAGGLWAAIAYLISISGSRLSHARPRQLQPPLYCLRSVGSWQRVSVIDCESICLRHSARRKHNANWIASARTWTLLERFSKACSRRATRHRRIFGRRLESTRRSNRRRLL